MKILIQLLLIIVVIGVALRLLRDGATDPCRRRLG